MRNKNSILVVNYRALNIIYGKNIGDKILLGCETKYYWVVTQNLVYYSSKLPIV